MCVFENRLTFVDPLITESMTALSISANERPLKSMPLVLVLLLPIMGTDNMGPPPENWLSQTPMRPEA